MANLDALDKNRKNIFQNKKIHFNFGRKCPQAQQVKNFARNKMPEVFLENKFREYFEAKHTNSKEILQKKKKILGLILDQNIWVRIFFEIKFLCFYKKTCA